MKALSLAQLRAIMQSMSQLELEDMICALYLSSNEAALFFNRCYNTEEYAQRVLKTYEKRMSIIFSCTHGHGAVDKARKCLEEFLRVVAQPDAGLELALYCLEGATRWACEEDLPMSVCDDMIEIFRKIVGILNEQESGELFQGYQRRIEQLEWESGAICGRYGELISELCLDIRWWGEEG